MSSENFFKEATISGKNNILKECQRRIKKISTISTFVSENFIVNDHSMGGEKLPS